MILSALLLIFATATLADRPVWYEGECGISKYEDAGVWPSEISKMIVGGIDGKPHEFPWQVSLRRSRTSGHFCGANIINDRWILTAAHCVEGTNPANVFVTVGEHDSTDDSNTNRQSYDVEVIFVHELYGAASRYDSDIAVLKTTEAITFNENVQPVCAPENEDDHAARDAQISGWGSLRSGGSCCPPILQWTEVVVTTNQYCNDLISAVGNIPVTDAMICSSDDGDHTDRDTCQGDSGGPMTVQNEAGEFEIIGLTSWGYGCASGTPGVYARVNFFNEWITAKIEKN